MISYFLRFVFFCLYMNYEVNRLVLSWYWFCFLYFEFWCFFYVFNDEIGYYDFVFVLSYGGVYGMDGYFFWFVGLIVFCKYVWV